MDDALKNILLEKSKLLHSLGIRQTIRDEPQAGSYSVDLDSTKYVGGIMYWPSGLYEFQFNSCESGNVILLETKSFSSKQELANFIEDLLLNRLPE